MRAQDKENYYQKEYHKMVEAFKHYHINNGEDDHCKLCGLDLRHKVHKR